MIGTLIGFELRRRLKMFSTWVYALVLFAGGFFLMAANAGLFKSISASSGSERVHANGPYSIFANLNVMALFGLFTVAAIFGQAIYEDFGTGTWPLIFTRNVKKVPYLVGRFFGAYVLAATLFFAIPVGMFLAAVISKFVDPSQLGDHDLLAYLWAYGVGALPMLFMSGAVFFTLAALTRQMAPVYVGMVVLVLGYFVLSTAIGDVSNKTIGAIADPFGFISFDVATRYWTAAEKNTLYTPLTGLYLVNRLLWLAVGGLLLAFAALRFKPTVEEQRGRKQDKELDTVPPGPLPTTRPTPTTSGWWATAGKAGWLAFRDVTKSAVYWSFIVAGIAFVLIGVLVSSQIYGTSTWPLSWQVLELASSMFQIFVLITLTFYAGEVVWKERDANIADVVDATRSPTWVIFLSKLIAMLLITASLEVVIGVAALTAQIARGYVHIEWRVYLTEIIVFGFAKNMLIAVLALTVQLLVNQKYLGHGVMVLYFVSRTAMGFLGVEEPLVQFGREPTIQYSDLNHYGHWLPATLTYRVYWIGITTLLLIVGFLFFPRGRERSGRRAAGQRFTAPWIAMAATGVVLAASAGGFIFFKTHVERHYSTSKDDERDTARYEKDWKAWATKPMPRIIDADWKLDLFPDEAKPRMEANGTYLLENKTEQLITELMISLPTNAKNVGVRIGNVNTPSRVDEPLGIRIYTLDPPMAPAERRPLEFSLRFVSEPFGERDTALVTNGTFVHNSRFPIIGYQEGAELSDDADRTKYELPKRERMRKQDDPIGLGRNYIRNDSDFIGFRATVSTSKDQIAVTPGKLVKEWVDGDRRYFRYEMSQPVLNLLAVLSARYVKVEDTWKDVKLEIFHHPTHTWNIERMMQGMKDSLEYCSTNFGPYQHEQARIFEFPRYQTYAQSLPNTIPYSESIGFIARVRDDDPEDLDYPYYVTAHEIAHQWWAHQVVGADVQGATMTSESMAQYAALMVMKKKYGPEKMRRFLKFELDRYLLGRATEQKKELPLSKVENQQYIHYQKGSLAMYWLQDLAGEAVVNRALKKYVEAVRFKGPPYTTSTELISYLRAELPAEVHPVIEDLFETITLYDNRAINAVAKQNDQGTWDVTVKIRGVKYRADEAGVQKEIPFDDVLEVGALDEEGNALFTEKRHVLAGESQVTFTMPTRPAKAGVDPLNKLIDRTSEDNVIAVE